MTESVDQRRAEEPALFKTGDYYVAVRSLATAINAEAFEQVLQFVVVHRPTGVVAGKSSQLPDAIRGCVNLDREQRIVDADPYSVAENASSGRAQ